MIERVTAGHDDVSRAGLTRVRVVAASAVLVVLALLAPSGWVPRVEGLDFMVLPAALIGAVSPIVGFRLYHYLRDRFASEPAAERRRGYLRATLLALAITEAAALFGVVVHALTGQPLALLGVLMHVLLAGALWPTPEKLELFIGESSSPAGPA